MTTEIDIQDCEEQLNFLRKAIEIANENGLLKNDPNKYNAILEKVINAHRNLEQTPPEIINARENFSKAYFMFNEAVNSTSKWWRFNYVYGGPIMIYLTAIFIGWIIFSHKVLVEKILFVPYWAFSWGLFGSILQGYWFVFDRVWKRAFRKCFYVYYIILPPLGAILGAMTYLVFHAGFMAATGEVEIQSDAFPMLLSALAGFSTLGAIEKLNDLVKKILVGEEKK